MLQKIAERKASLQAVDYESSKNRVAKMRGEKSSVPGHVVRKSMPPNGLPPLKMISSAKLIAEKSNNSRQKAKQADLK